MKGLFKKLSILVVSLAMVFGVGLVNNEKSAKAAEEVYKSLTFPDDNQENNKVSAYDVSWTAKNGADSYTITNANNNRWNNKWTYIKMGSKNAAYVGTITTDFAIDKAITKVVTTIDKVTASSINSTYLEVASDSEFKTIVEKVTVNIAQGNLAYTITNPSANLFYRLTFDCKKSSNGVVQISKVGYYAEIAERTLDNLTLSGTLNKSTYTVGEAFSSEGLTITANYSDGSTEDVTSKVTWPELTIGMTSITGTYEDKTILVTGITVKEKPTDLVLSEIKITEGENVKKTYYIGDVVDSTGLTVTARYLSKSDSNYEISTDVTDKVYWTLDTTVANAEAKLTASFTDGDVTKTAFITVVVEVVRPLPTTENWTLVEDATTLKAGDKLVLTENTKGKVASSLSGDFLSEAAATFSLDHKTMDANDEEALILTLGGKSGAWTLSNSNNELLGATAQKKVAFGKGTTTWTISIDSEAKATIQNTTLACGRFLYNVKSPRFTTYTSSVNASMLLIQLYRCETTYTEVGQLMKDIQDADFCSDYSLANGFLARYENLSEEDKAYFKNAIISEDGTTYLERLNFFAAKAGQNQLTSYNLLSDKHQNLYMLILISGLGLASVLGYYFINKKRMLSK